MEEEPVKIDNTKLRVERMKEYLSKKEQSKKSLNDENKTKTPFREKNEKKEAVIQEKNEPTPRVKNEGVQREKNFVLREKNDAPSRNLALREEFEEQLISLDVAISSLNTRECLYGRPQTVLQI